MKKIIILVAAIFTSLSLVACKKPDKIIKEIIPGTIKGRVMTDRGDLLTAGIIVEDEEGNMERMTTNFLSGFVIDLNPGKYKLTFTRGFEYSIVKIDVEIESYEKMILRDIRLKQLNDMTDKNWYMGELHQHTTYSDGKNNVDEVLLSNITHGFHYGFLTDHDDVSAQPEWMSGNKFISNINKNNESISFVPLRGVEVTTSYGHYQSLGMGMIFEPIQPSLGHDPRQRILDMMTTVRSSGGIAQINHPSSKTQTMAFNYWEDIDYFDTMEIWNGAYLVNMTENLNSRDKWFEIINSYIEGKNKFIAATAGTDNHNVRFPYKYQDVSGQTEVIKLNDLFKRKAVERGIPTTVLNIKDQLNEENILNAIKQGNSFVTNGPILIANIEDKTYGETYELNGSTKVNVKIDLFSREMVEKLNIYKNGEIIKTIELKDFNLNYIEELELDNINKNDWLVFEAIGSDFLYAITNPIFIK